VSDLALWAERALTPGRVLERVRLVARGGRIAELRAPAEPEPGDGVHRGGTLAPGLVDLQVNGALGAGFEDADVGARRRAADHHVRAGTTSLLAALVSAPLERLEAALERLRADAREGGPVLGVHLEGPFLDEQKRGAHDAAALCDPTQERVERLAAAAGPALRLVTLAPERTGALEAIERFASGGAVVAAGHSRARFARVEEAVARGLSFVTHVGNASDWPTRAFDAALGHRASEPGLIGAFLCDRRLRGSLILDGRHLHPGLARALVELRGTESVALVSDATPATGLAPGRYRLGRLEVELHPGGYATAGEGLAGSAVPLLEMVRVAVREAGLPLAQALEMASLTPARVLGLGEKKGRLAEGFDADLLVLDDALALRAVYRAGARVPLEAG
jgi:N-acetylglucosamine-6-phosphate deacetylase